MSDAESSVGGFETRGMPRDEQVQYLARKLMIPLSEADRLLGNMEVE